MCSLVSGQRRLPTAVCAFIHEPCWEREQRDEKQRELAAGFDNSLLRVNAAVVTYKRHQVDDVFAAARAE
jgi:hypothetical protein